MFFNKYCKMCCESILEAIYSNAINNYVLVLTQLQTDRHADNAHRPIHKKGNMHKYLVFPDFRPWVFDFSKRCSSKMVNRFITSVASMFYYCLVSNDTTLNTTTPDKLALCHRDCVDTSVKASSTAKNTTAIRTL